MQRLHLTPADFATQQALTWAITAPGIDKALALLRRLRQSGASRHHRYLRAMMAIIAEGEVETSDAAGVVSGLPGLLPDAVFLRQTRATQPDQRLAAARATLQRASKPVLEPAHALMQDIQASGL